MFGVSVEFGDYFRSRLVQGRHGNGRGVNPALLRFALLDGGRNHACAQGLGEDELVAGAGAGVGEDAVGMDGAGDGVSELEFLVANGVAADDGASGFDHLAETAGENLLENVEIAFVGKADQGEGVEGTSAHGVDVAERVGGGDLAEGVRVVDDRGKKIHGLDEGKVRGNFVHAGVVGFVEADQNVRVLLPG